MYTFSQKFLHWVMGGLIIGLLLCGFIMVDMTSPIKWSAYTIHKSVGLIVFLLIPIRLFIRFMHPPKNTYENVSKLNKILILLSVPILYVTMFTMSFSGIVMSEAGGYGINFFGFYKVPSFLEKSEFLSSWAYFIHSQFAFIATVIIILHILASLYHHFVLKDNTLKNMLFKPDR